MKLRQAVKISKRKPRKKLLPYVTCMRAYKRPWNPYGNIVVSAWLVLPRYSVSRGTMSGWIRAKSRRHAMERLQVDGMSDTVIGRCL